MIDGKVTQAVTNTSSSSNCVICGAKPTEMNNLSAIRPRPSNEEALHLGMSPLYARIRFMEYVSHLAYNLTFKAWRTSKSALNLKQETKGRIQKEFIEKMGIKVDVVKQGVGTLNDGNTSPEFFGIGVTVIKKLSVILETICSSYSIDPHKFGTYAEETAMLAIELYPWYYLPATVHKILFHGAEIISLIALPIGSLSEEAQESRNRTINTIEVITPESAPVWQPMKM